MTCMRCVTIMGPCREAITQVTEHSTQPITGVPMVDVLTEFVYIKASCDMFNILLHCVL